MKCSKIKRKLSAYSDGELDTTQKEIVEVHLQGCESCRQVLENLVTSWDLLDTLPTPEPVPYFYTRIKNRMASGEKERKWRWVDRILIPASAVAVIIFGIVVGSIVGRNGSRLTGEITTEDEMVNSLYLDTFDDFPSASLGDVYFTIASLE